MADDELTVFLILIGIVALYLGYVVNKWKIHDLEDRVEELEQKWRKN